MHEFRAATCGRTLASLIGSAGILLGTLGVGPTAEAMRVTPMVAEVTVTGAGSSARIEVGNEGSEPLPYETHITRVDFNERGEIHETPADSDFLVFPPQGLVGAHSSQTIRVQWLGDPTLKSSRSYYLEIRQIPVALNPQPADSGAPPTVALQIVYRIKALITVAPQGAQSKVSVVSIEPAIFTPRQQVKLGPGVTSKTAVPQPSAPVPGLKVTLKNDGNRHALMGGVNWIFDGVGADGKPFHETISDGEIGTLIGVGYLPPEGGTRVFTVPFDHPYKGALKLRFTE